MKCIQKSGLDYQEGHLWVKQKLGKPHRFNLAYAGLLATEKSYCTGPAAVHMSPHPVGAPWIEAARRSKQTARSRHTQPCR